MTSPDDLRSLFELATTGDRAAADRLFARAADRLLLFVRLRLGPGLRTRVDEHDVLQEVFVHAHRDFARFDARDASDPERAFVRWLCALAENRLRDLAAFHRRKRRDPAREQRDVTAVLSELHRQGHGPATSLVRREERDQLANGVGTLEADDREVLLLRFFEGLTVDAIADRTGRSSSAVRRSLGRATVQLGRRLGEVRP